VTAPNAAPPAPARARLANSPVTLVLIAANVVAFGIAASRGGGFWTPVPETLVRSGANFGPLTADGEPWRAITSLFVHFGAWHLAINMVALGDLGRAAEQLYGAARYLLLYFAAGIVASLASVAWNPWVNSAGASGAIFGLLGALLAGSVSARHRMPRGAVLAHWLTAAMFVAFSVLVDLAGAGVDHASHAAGLATGFALGLVLAPETGRRRPAAMAIAALLAIALGGALFALQRNAGPAWRQETAFAADVERFVEDENARGEALRQMHAQAVRGEVERGALADTILLHAAQLEADRARLVAYRLDPSSPSEAARMQRVLDAALTLRGDAMGLRAAAVRDNDRELAAAAEEALARSDALWRREMCVKRGKPGDCDAGKR
jgi:membrane associated rhomboid family serine protease